jgi:hypothetical protein
MGERTTPTQERILVWGCIVQERYRDLQYREDDDGLHFYLFGIIFNIEWIIARCNRPQ